MFKGLILSGVAAIAMAMPSNQTHMHTLCEGFVPENSMYIPVGIMAEQGLNEQQFNDVLDAVEKIYSDIVSEKGGELDLRRRWSDGTVNASAQRMGNRYIVNMYGGLARHRTITKDGFTLVACHELGHHLGGAPKISGWMNQWASNEGQSDYFASLKCMRLVFPDEENQEWVENNEVDPVVAEKCNDNFNSEAEIALCKRTSTAGMSVSALFQELRNQTNPPRYDTPDPRKVRRTSDRHPDTQCRLDTYFQGSLCVKTVAEDVDKDDATQGTCTRSAGFNDGIRPLCWYKPASI